MNNRIARYSSPIARFAANRMNDHRWDHDAPAPVKWFLWTLATTVVGALGLVGMADLAALKIGHDAAYAIADPLWLIAIAAPTAAWAASYALTRAIPHRFTLDFESADTAIRNLAKYDRPMARQLRTDLFALLPAAQVSEKAGWSAGSQVSSRMETIRSAAKRALEVEMAKSAFADAPRRELEERLKAERDARDTAAALAAFEAALADADCASGQHPADVLANAEEDLKVVQKLASNTTQVGGAAALLNVQ